MSARKKRITCSFIALLFVCSVVTHGQRQTQTQRPQDIVAAVRACDVDTVKLIGAIHPELLNVKDAEGSLLLLSAKCKDTAVAEYLIEQGASIDKTGGKWGDVPLINAALSERNVPLFKLLLAKHAKVQAHEVSYALSHKFDETDAEILNAWFAVADVNALDEFGNSFVHYRQDKPFVEALAAHGANFNVPSKNGETPLRLAVKSAARFCRKSPDAGFPAGYGSDLQPNLEDVQALLDAGAGLQSDPLLLRECRFKELCDLLISRGADVNAQDSGGKTFLHQVVWETSQPARTQPLSEGNPIPPDCGLDRDRVGKLRYLLEHGANPNLRAEYEGPPLVYAAYNDAPIEAINLLLDYHADPSATDEHGNTVLHWAVEHSNAAMLELLLKLGVDPNIGENTGDKPLLLARKPEITMLLLKYGAKVDAKGFSEYNALHKAVERGDEDQVKLLLATGLLPNSPSENGNTPVHMVWSVPIAKMLLAAGGDVKQKNGWGATPLHIAAERHVGEIAKLFIAAGADVNARDDFKVTPLDAAADNGNAQVAKVLLDNGANLNLRNQWGMTPLETSREARRNRAPQDQKYFDETELVLEAGRNSNNRRLTAQLAELMAGKLTATEVQGNYALHLAAALGNLPVMQAQLKAGTPLWIRNGEKRTPLHEAAANPSSPALENIKLLLTHGADVNARDGFNSTPLHEAVKAPPSAATVAAVQFFLAQRADANVKDTLSRKPLDIAKSEREYYAKYYPGAGKVEIEKYLNEIIALLEKVTVATPSRRIFGQTKTSDDHPVSALVFLNDGIEPFVRLGNLRADGTGSFEFQLDEGRKFHLLAFYDGEKDGKVVHLHAVSEIMTVKGDQGPIILTLIPSR